MKPSWLLCFFLLLPLSLSGRSNWTVPQQITAPSIYDTGTNIATCYLEETGELFAIWHARSGHFTPSAKRNSVQFALK